jgi:hypothetical protein
MYNITFSRYKKRGFFKKEFKTIDEIVKFYLKANNKLRIPKLHKELSKKEIMIFGRKLDSQLMLAK